MKYIFYFTVILVTFPLHQWLHERVTALRYMYSACQVLHFLFFRFNNIITLKQI